MDQGSNLRNSGQSCQYFVTLQQAHTLDEMIEINMKIKVCESRTLTLGTLSTISLGVDFLNIYYNIFNNPAIIYIGILQYYNKVHETLCSTLRFLFIAYFFLAFPESHFLFLVVVDYGNDIFLKYY